MPPSPQFQAILDRIRKNVNQAFPNKRDTFSGMASNDRNIPGVGTGQITVTSQPQQISYVSRTRTAIKLTNLSASVEIWWGTTPTLIPGDSTTIPPGNGDLLPSGRGSWVSIPGATIIWVACVAPNTARMSWAEKYADD